MSYLAGIHDLAYCFQRLGGAGSSAYSGDWLGTGANLGAAAGKGMWYARNQVAVLRDVLGKTGTKVLPTPTAIIDAAMVAISTVDLLNGFGPPDTGAALTNGMQKFEITSLQLSAANPDERDWSGASSKSYADANEALRNLVDKMQELDGLMHVLVGKQGSEVENAHTTIAVTLLGLVVAQGIALALYLIPVVGPEVSCAWQIVSSLAAGAAVVTQEMATLSESIAIANAVDNLALGYGEVAAQARRSGLFSRFEVAGAEQTVVDAAEAAFAATPAGSPVPTVATLGGLAGDSALGDRLAMANDLVTSGSDMHGSQQDREKPSTPASPVSPAAAMAAMSAMSAMSAQSAQGAKMLARGSQLMNVVNQTTALARQAGTSGAQSHGPAIPPGERASDEATVAGQIRADSAVADAADGTNAAAGGLSAERVPIDIATLGPEPQWPRAGDRMG
ncbi:EspA/EspE family type VII secretion system effector [Mycobacterium camsae]|uniref:EspA/EspE family type VII secretion system effector n=1 Tax=Mycobacterium gordonae TaxID=1778 RepID=UPI00197D0915|nr:EspA/EspE family type VII secretion system effector [Mycobacterium gordonae]